ncbi:MAG TPA: hypothetical protein VM307_09770 [Egibacteraceae bacterium]|nr:hypothetical protein [Egibacteraceae bacterium]
MLRRDSSVVRHNRDSRDEVLDERLARTAMPLARQLDADQEFRDRDGGDCGVVIIGDDVG